MTPHQERVTLFCMVVAMICFWMWLVLMWE
jgi:cytochrome c-type biogenesis protein CcmE